MESEAGLLFLVPDDVLAIHEALIHQTQSVEGDPDVDPIVPGVLNHGPIHAATERCRWGPFHHGGSLPERAAYLLRGIAQDHPFTDGNKRTAFEATDTFLRVNGCIIGADEATALTFMKEAAMGLDLGEVLSWLDEHTRNLFDPAGRGTL